MRKFSTKDLAYGAVVAAVYTVLTLALPFQYGEVQYRVAEAMTVLPFFFPEAIPGLAVGCFLANVLMSPIPLDWIFGTAATLLAALWTRRMPNLALAPLPPVICNAVIVGAEIAWFSVQDGEAFLPAFGFNALTVGLGEAVAACVSAGCPVPVVRHGVEDVFGRSGKAERVLEHFGLSPEGIAAKVRQALELKK